MKSLLILLTFFATLYANEANETLHIKKPLGFSVPLLEPLEPLAIQLGEGSIKVYAFIDPLCPHSRNFVDLVVNSQKLQKQYHYYFFLYTLPRLKSQNMVRTLLGSPNILTDLKHVMVEQGDLLMTPSTETIEERVRKIEEVAVSLDVYKRPYLILVKPTKAFP